MAPDCRTRRQSSRTVPGGPEGATEVPQAPAQGDDRIRVPNNHRWLIQPSHSRARTLGQPQSGYGVPRVAHQLPPCYTPREACIIWVEDGEGQSCQLASVVLFWNKNTGVELPGILRLRATSWFCSSLGVPLGALTTCSLPRRKRARKRNVTHGARTVQ
jgi:hypothetical protein